MSNIRSLTDHKKAYRRAFKAHAVATRMLERYPENGALQCAVDEAEFDLNIAERNLITWFTKQVAQADTLTERSIVARKRLIAAALTWQALTFEAVQS